MGKRNLKIIEQCKEAGLPEPDIKELTGGILVIFYKDRYNETLFRQFGLNIRQKKAIEYLKLHKKISNSHYQEINDCSRNTASNDLSDLVKKEILESSESKGSGAYYTLI